ncbi:FREQ [Hepatospora eriocheir]|uniref:FREQ n=1 Tax=Hepatospora eriocheir TaxID=1081669 RepID=A0A1X0QGR0_9MICR|nr:FREQ [Hepatospora eriocheir]
MGNRISFVNEQDKEIRKFKHFQPKDIREWSKEFKSLFPLKYITVSDLYTLFKTHFPLNLTNDLTIITHLKPDDVTEINKSINRFCCRLFKALNIADNGKITLTELLISTSKFIRGSTFEKTTWIFRFYDINQEGEISRETFSETIDDMFLLIYGQFCKDKSNELVNQLYNSLNKDHNSSLTLEDFIQLYENHFDLLKN